VIKTTYHGGNAKYVTIMVTGFDIMRNVGKCRKVKRVLWGEGNVLYFVFGYLVLKN